MANGSTKSTNSGMLATTPPQKQLGTFWVIISPRRRPPLRLYLSPFRILSTDDDTLLAAEMVRCLLSNDISSVPMALSSWRALLETSMNFCTPNTTRFFEPNPTTSKRVKKILVGFWNASLHRTYLL